ncbi:MAG: hypothetical protein ABEH86_02130 [Haloarcula sp.]
MGEDASLDDFLDVDGDSESGSASDRDNTGGKDADSGSAGVGDTNDNGESVDSGHSTGAVEPAVTTYAWSPEGEICPECGDVVERQWRQDGQLVCSACKAW